ncbi:MAG: sulfite exporter TauE/SafE family protein [Pseudodesulfovibrio sp.]|nr:sulfite exporter TauE/SafE family protein [Pseudodesulfovibrio sp.]
MDTVVAWPCLVLLGIFAGIIGSFFGMGAGWLIVPGLNVLGFPMPIAIGTGFAHMAGNSISSFFQPSRFCDVDYKLGFIMSVGSVIGIEIGAQVVMRLELFELADVSIRCMYLIFLITIVWMIYRDYREIVCGEGRELHGSRNSRTAYWPKVLHKFSLAPVIHFRTSGITCSVWLPFIVSVIAGILTGLMGIGGSILRIPVLVYILGCTTLVAVRTNLITVLIAGLYGVFTYGIKGRFEVEAAFIVLVCVGVGLKIGNVASKYSTGCRIRPFFGVSVLCCALALVFKQFGYGMLGYILFMVALGLLCCFIMKNMGAMIMGAYRDKYKHVE